MDAIFLVIGYFLTVFVLVTAFVVHRRRAAAAAALKADGDDDAAAENGAAAGGRRAGGADAAAAAADEKADLRERLRARIQAARDAPAAARAGATAATAPAPAARADAKAGAGDGDDDGDVDGDADADGDDTAAGDGTAAEAEAEALLAAGGKLTKAMKKEVAKQQRKREVEGRARAIKEANEAKQKAQDAYIESRRKKDAEREAVEKAKAEVEAKKRAEIAKAEEEEFNQWSKDMAVEGTGTDVAESGTESDGLLEEFISHIKRQKVVVLDDLASEWKLRTHEVVSRITTLESSGRLTGVLDDRGKFIYITPAELDSLASWIKRRGRISIHDFIAESNKLINLNPVTAPVPVATAAAAAS